MVDTFLSLLAFLYLYFFFLVPNIIYIWATASYYSAYDPIPTIFWLWEYYIKQWSVFRWPANLLLTIKKWHDDWHHRQSERLGHWKHAYFPVLILGAIAILQALSGCAVPVTYVIGPGLAPAFQDGDMVLLSARRPPRAGDFVLYFNASAAPPPPPHPGAAAYYLGLGAKIPVVTASADDPLQIRRIARLGGAALRFKDGALVAAGGGGGPGALLAGDHGGNATAAAELLTLCTTAGDHTDDCAEVPAAALLGVATLRVPRLAVPLRCVQRLGAWLAAHTRTGRPGSLWAPVDAWLTEAAARARAERAAAAAARAGGGGGGGGGGGEGAAGAAAAAAGAGGRAGAGAPAAAPAGHPLAYLSELEMPTIKPKLPAAVALAAAATQEAALARAQAAAGGPLGGGAGRD